MKYFPLDFKQSINQQLIFGGLGGQVVNVLDLNLLVQIIGISVTVDCKHYLQTDSVLVVKWSLVFQDL